MRLGLMINVAPSTKTPSLFSSQLLESTPNVEEPLLPYVSRSAGHFQKLASFVFPDRCTLDLAHQSAMFAESCDDFVAKVKWILPKDFHRKRSAAICTYCAWWTPCPDDATA